MIEYEIEKNLEIVVFLIFEWGTARVGNSNENQKHKHISIAEKHT